MASLWTSITFPVQTIRKLDPPFTLYIHPKSVRLMSWWKEFLADVPPSIYLFKPPLMRKSRSTNVDIDTLDKAYTTFFCGSFFRSARSLVLNIINQDLDNICSDPTPFPNLRDLRIKADPDSRIPRIPVSAFPPAPRLVYLHLAHSELFRQRLLDVFPWAQLTHLYIPRTVPYDCFQSLMRLSTSLKLASFILLTDNPPLGAPVPVPVPVATHDVCSLRHLVIAVSNGTSVISRAFDSLHFPALTALRVCSVAYPLTDIVVVHQVLGTMPTLEELHFDNTLSFADSYVLPFRSSPAGRTLGMLVPRLRHLVIDFVDPSRENVGANIVSFLQSAWICKGWPERDAREDPVLRHLEFVIENDSLVEIQPVPDEIVAEVTGYLETGGRTGLPFKVSITDADSVATARHIFNVFDEQLPSQGWNSAVKFYDKL